MADGDEYRIRCSLESAGYQLSTCLWVCGVDAYTAPEIGRELCLELVVCLLAGVGGIYIRIYLHLYIFVRECVCVCV